MHLIDQILGQSLLKILACPVCKSDVEQENNSLVCVNCNKKFPVVDGIPIMLPKLTEDLRLTQEKWDKEYKDRYNPQSTDLFSNPELRDNYLHVNKFMRSKDGLFLEGGCGTAKISCQLAKEGVQTVGMDISLNALRLASMIFKREGLDGLFVCGNIMELPFKENIFTYVYTGGVLEHFKDTQIAVDEIYRCLMPGGLATNLVPCLSLSTPYRILRWGNIPDVFLLRNITEFIGVKLLKERHMRFGYEKSFTAGKMKKKFGNAKFKNIEIGLFKTYYPLEPVKSDFLKMVITKIANTRPFWPMIYVNGEK